MICQTNLFFLVAVTPTSTSEKQGSSKPGTPRVQQKLFHTVALKSKFGDVFRVFWEEKTVADGTSEAI